MLEFGTSRAPAGKTLSASVKFFKTVTPLNSYFPLPHLRRDSKQIREDDEKRSTRQVEAPFQANSRQQIADSSHFIYLRLLRVLLLQGESLSG